MSKIRLTLSALLAAACLGFVPAALAQGQHDLFQQALRRERTQGDLEGAIRLYRQVSQGSDRVLAARALVRMGEAYERLGQDGAESAYRRILADFADQKEPADRARSRLNALRRPSAPAAALSLVYSDLPPLRQRDNAQFDFSPDGERIVVRLPADPADSGAGGMLAVVSSGGTVTRTILPSRRNVSRMSPRWSPDGRHIAFFERAMSTADSQFASIVVLPTDGGPARVLYSRVDLITGPAQGGLLWTPDSRGLTAATRDTLLTIGLDGKVIRTVPLRVPQRMQVSSYSPDGRWIAFHRVNQGSEQPDEIDIWIVPAQGGAPVQLTQAPGYDGWPSWGAEGRSVYFISDRGGSQNVWKLEIDPSTGAAQGEPTQITSHTDALMLHPRPVNGGRKLAFSLVRQTTGIHVASSDAPASARVVARGSQPLLSPDGQRIYYLGERSDEKGIFAVSIDGSSPRRITAALPNGPFFRQFSLSADGTTLAFFSQTGSQNVLHTVSTVDGAMRELLRLDSREHLVPAFSPDGTRLAYSHKTALYSIAATGGEPTKLAELKSWDGWTVRWSPDGEHIAAFGWADATTASSSDNAIFVVPARGGALRRITSAEESGYKEGLEWHPDGKRLSYMYYGVDDRGDGSRMAYLDGRPTTLLVNQAWPLWDYTGVWHPSGARYYFGAATRQTWNLYAHDSASETSSLVWDSGTSHPGAGLPSWSRDGRLMAWEVARSTRQLWTIDLTR